MNECKCMIEVFAMKSLHLRLQLRYYCPYVDRIFHCWFVPIDNVRGFPLGTFGIIFLFLSSSNPDILHSTSLVSLHYDDDEKRHVCVQS